MSSAQQVAVAVDGVAAGDAVDEHGGAAVEPLAGEALDLGQRLGVEDGIDALGERGHLRQVGRPGRADRVVGGVAVDRRTTGGAGVEGGDAVGHRAHVVRDVGVALGDEGRQAPLRRHAPHLDHVLDVVAVGPDHVEHPEVDVGAQAPVELHLAHAGLAAGLDGGEVEEREPDRLLDLVDPVAEEDEARDVGLHHPVGVVVLLGHGGLSGSRRGRRPVGRRRWCRAGSGCGDRSRCRW